jgi:tetratricopeptide (TPR) repeat protein
MYKTDKRRVRSAAIIVVASLATASLAAAQAPKPDSPNDHPLQASATPAPHPTPTPEEMGDSLMAHRRYQAAIEAYKHVVPASPAVWNKMGIAYQMMFNLEEATRCYQVSLKLDPKNVNVLNNLGTVYDSLKDYKKAVKMYHRALKYDPKSALVLKNLGTDLLAQRKYTKGWEVYQSALAIDPQIFDHTGGPRVENPASVQERGAMNYYMAKGCVRAGKNEQAIEYLRMALDEGFTSPKKIAADQEFAGLRGIPAFEQLLTEQKAQ